MKKFMYIGCFLLCNVVFASDKKGVELLPKIKLPLNVSGETKFNKVKQQVKNLKLSSNTQTLLCKLSNSTSLFSIPENLDTSYADQLNRYSPLPKKKFPKNQKVVVSKIVEETGLQLERFQLDSPDFSTHEIIKNINNKKYRKALELVENYAGLFPSELADAIRIALEKVTARGGNRLTQDQMSLACAVVRKSKDLF